MGIPSYFISLLKTNNKLLTKFTNKLIVNGLYFDSNSIIYDAIRELEIEYDKQNQHNISSQHTQCDPLVITNTLIYEKVCEKLNEYIKRTKPEDDVFISFDGVSPAAKMEQQRQRRYKSQLISSIKEHHNTNVTSKFNTNQITPGTQFMEMLCEYVKKYFNNRYYKNSNGVNINIILSLSDIAGEGEHKIYNYIRNKDTTNKQYNHVVYGIDSDLIMLSLINSDVVSNIYLLRETPHFIQTINKQYNPNTLYYINFNTAKHIITHDIHPDDYVVIGFILGNDFIPHNPAFNIRKNGLDTVLHIYKELFKSSIETRYITKIVNGIRVLDNINLKAYFKQLSYIEKDEFKRNIQIKLKNSQNIPNINSKETTLDDKLNFIPKLDFNIEYNIFNNETETTPHMWKINYYKLCLNTDYNNENDIHCILNNYLDAIQWNFNYYTQYTINQFWKYDYHHSPLMCDIAEYMDDYFSMSQCSNKNDDDTTTISNIHPQTQLAYVLPRESYIFLNKNVKKYIEQYEPLVIHHNLNYHYEFSSYLWEGHITLNYVDIKELNNKILSIL
jgi:5'-3' exoribonuclease 2